MQGEATRIVAIDDDLGTLFGYEMAFAAKGVEGFSKFSDALVALDFIENKGQVKVAIIDLIMPMMDGLDVLEKIKCNWPEIECIVITAVDETDSAVKAVKLGAYDYLVKPVSPEKLLLTVQRAMERYDLRRERELGRRHASFEELEYKDSFYRLVARDKEMARVFHQAEAAARTDYPVLISGESGTGKELLARTVHDLSPRHDKPFVAVNLAAMGNALFEDAFFGHEKGSFTGATSDTKGYFETANGGTLFLDEITEVGTAFQAKLLRAIQEKEIIRQGTTRTTSIDVRIISATNIEIDDALANGDIRPDFYYRLSMTVINIPPLRERPDDILPLAKHFLTLHAEKNGKTINRIDEEAQTALQRYLYPGNVRELENFIAGAVLEEDSTVLTLGSLKHLSTKKINRRSTDLSPLRLLEKNHILRVLEHTDGNRTEAANLLQISRSTLKRKLASYEN